MRWPILALVAILIGGLAAFAVVEASRGGGDGDGAQEMERGGGDDLPDAGEGEEAGDAGSGDGGSSGGGEGSSLPRARCPAELSNCRSASGRIVYVEAVDPDGDGDAHFVLASTDSITAPGITVVDVGVHLRPEPLPGVGARISAAGPVYPGSYGQRQIEAVELHVAGR